MWPAPFRHPGESRGPCKYQRGGVTVGRTWSRPQENPMPDMHLYFAFVLAVTILMLIPGPNVALIVANSVAYGPRYGLLTVAGTSSAMVLQLALTVLGLTELLGTLGTWFEWIRWIGGGYLIYL